MLLLHGWDPLRPRDPFWFTIGGAVEHGETLPEAAVRELREEAGIVVDPASCWASRSRPRRSTFWWAGMHFDQDQTFYAFAVGDAEVSFAGQEALERATIDKHGWLRPEELDGGGERPADPELPRLMRLAVAAVLG